MNIYLDPSHDMLQIPQEEQINVITINLGKVVLNFSEEGLIIQTGTLVKDIEHTINEIILPEQTGYYGADIGKVYGLLSTYYATNLEGEGNDLISEHTIKEIELLYEGGVVCYDSYQRIMKTYEDHPELFTEIEDYYNEEYMN